MLQEVPAHSLAALGAFAAFAYLATTALCLRSLLARGTVVWGALLLSVFAGPLCLPFAVFAAHRKLHEKPGAKASDGFWARGADGIFSVGGFAVAAAVVLGGVLGTWAFQRFGNDLIGEPLQVPLLKALVVAGLVGGYLQATFARRVGFIEALCVTAFVAAVPVAGGRYAGELFSYGTAPAYFAVVLIAAYLVLTLTMVLGGSFGYLFTGDGDFVPSWSYEWRIGQRYLMGKRSNKVVGLITVISVLAVAVGTMAMIVVMSVMNGFSTDLRSKIFGANAHLIVLKYGTDFTEYSEIVDKTRDVEGVTGASPFVLNEVMISSDVNLSGALLKGIDVPTIDQVSVLRSNMTKGDLEHLRHPEKIIGTGAASVTGGAVAPVKPNPDEAQSESDALADAIALATAGTPADTRAKEMTILPGIVIGAEMSRNLKVFVGDTLNVVSPVGELGPTGPVPKARAFRIAGIFYSGMYEYDSKFVYIDLAEAQDFFTLKGGVTGIEYRVDDIETTGRISRDMMMRIGGYPYRTKDWMEMNKNLFSALKLEKIAMFVILTFITLVASFLIAATLIVFVIEKGKEIAILKSMGSSDTSIMKIFVTYGVIVGGVGTLVGLSVGLLICFVIQTFGIGLDPDVYYITHLPVHVDPVEVVLVATSAVVLSYLGTIYPALLAARMRPVEGLRYE